METVKIASPKVKGDYVVINVADFDPKKHQLFETPPKAPKSGAGKE